MTDIALLGFGTVGSGVAEVIDDRREYIKKRLGDEVRVKYILDLRDFPGSRYESRIVHDYGIILNDPDVRVVAEMMGGVHPAADFSRAALEAGKSVVTSNKAVVADCGAELLELARKRGVRYLLEASVGGGIPVVRPMTDDLAENEITKISGILNGTTNFILSKMESEGASFPDALAEAQRLGYAEADPTADVEGYDAARKILILAALAWGKLFPLEAVETLGIRSLTRADVEAAASEGYRVKLVATAEKLANGKIALSVSPRRVPSGTVLASTDGVFNAVRITGSVTGDVLFYGRGAGKLPTAGAVVSDIIDALERKSFAPPALFWGKGTASDVSSAGDLYLSVLD